MPSCAEPGDYKTLDVSGLSVLVVRGQDGAVTARVNECRHRGAIVVEGRGNARRFVCPYHAWSYDTSGALVAIPSEASFCGLDKSSNGLVELPVREEHGLIWVIADPAGRFPDGDLVHGLGEDLRQMNFDRWHYQYTHPMAGRLNWKIALEGFFETYHLPFLHRTTAAGLFYDNVITFDAFGPHFRYAWPRRTIDELRGVPQDEWVDPIRHINLLYFLFPNTVLLYNAGMWQVYPGDEPGTSTTLFNFFTIGDDPTMTDAQKMRFEFAHHVTSTEDLPAGESMQRNFEAVPEGEINLGTNEVCIHHLHRGVRAAIGE